MSFRKSNLLANKYRLTGNEFYESSDFRDALRFYNKSLCHAIQSTEEFALGFANRSAVYFEIEEFEACIENIQMAIHCGYPKNKMKKLHERFDRCLEQIECYDKGSSKDPWEFFKLSYPSNKKIPYIIDCVELRESKKYGRHLITTRKLNAGDIIAIEKPFYKYIMNTSRFTHCANCLKSEKLNLLPCHKCNYTMFCSKECMSIGHRFHQFECDIDINMDQDSCIFQMCHRTVFEALGIFGKIGKLKAYLEENSDAKTIFDIGDLSSMENKEKEMQLLLATDCLQRNPLRPELEIPMEEHCKIMMTITDNSNDKDFLHDFMINQMRLIITNSFGLLNDDDDDEIGAGVFPFASYFNHSCAPNIFRTTVDGSLVFIAIRPIEKDQQLFVCYRENFFYTDLESRQNELLEAYNFTCKCEACRNYYPTFDTLPRNDTQLKISSSNSLTLNLILDEYKKNCDYINANNQKYPSYEICKLIERNYELLSFIVCITTSCAN